MKISSDDKAYCCHKDCGQCGGGGCKNDPLGGNNCCGSIIEADGRVCSSEGTVAPCIYSDKKYAECKTDVNRESTSGPNNECETADDCCKGYDCLVNLRRQLVPGPSVSYCTIAWGNVDTKGCCVKNGGIPDIHGSTCCDSACGTCGGSSCGLLPGGKDNCCAGVIRRNTAADKCPLQPFSGTPPCAVDTMFCSEGILSPNGEVCCDSDCGSCGGAGCKARPGGRECCAAGIMDYCDHSGSITCKVPHFCMDGIVNPENTICCPASCGSCGGTGCEARPGGSQCCETGASNAGTCETFEQTGCELPWVPVVLTCPPYC